MLTGHNFSSAFSLGYWGRISEAVSPSWPPTPYGSGTLAEIGFRLPLCLPCPGRHSQPLHCRLLGKGMAGWLQAASPCPKQLSGFRPPKALVLLGEGKAVSSCNVQTNLERLEKIEKRVREITLMPGNAPDPLKNCRNQDEGDFLQMLKCLLVMYPMLKGG